MSDMVCHPRHYNQGDIECIDAIQAATVGKTGVEAFCVGNAIKYLWRFEEKNGLQDVEKAKWYIERLIRELDDGEDFKNTVTSNDGDKVDCIDCIYWAKNTDEEPCCYCKNNLTEESKKCSRLFFTHKAIAK